jgi:protein involved in polysaccharide export with SLBB domain
MDPLKQKRGELIFACFIMIYFILSRFGMNMLFAQTGYEPRWSKSAKSLTIFQPGDAVRIQVWELYQEQRRNLNLSADYPINPQGFIIMPLVGEVKVKGLTVYELMQTLDTKLSQYLKNPYIYVSPLIRITMQGAFNRPGSYRVDPQSSLWNLVALAGGPRADCNLKGIWVERGGRRAIKNLLESFEKGYSIEEIGIESGDQIIAPPRRGLNLGMIIGIVNLMASLVLIYIRIRYGSL